MPAFTAALSAPYSSTVTEPSQPQATAEAPPTSVPAPVSSTTTTTSQASTGAGTEASGWQDSGSVLGEIPAWSGHLLQYIDIIVHVALLASATRTASHCLCG